MGAQGGRTCISCDSTELEIIRRGHWCLDCGARFEVSPAGTSVRSLRTWWALTIVNATIGILSFGVAATYLVSGDHVFTPVFALFGLIVTAIEGERFRAAVTSVR